MIFPKFIVILKSFFRRRISNDKLCTLLFGSVIETLDLKNRYGDPVYIDKRTISKIMNQKQGIPVSIRNHLYDEEVIRNMVPYFQNHIANQLIPEFDDLFYQIMQEIDKDADLSPQRKAAFRMMANRDTAAVFLAQVFLYTVMRSAIVDENGASAKEEPCSNTAMGKKTDNSLLILKGISKEDSLAETPILLDFSEAPVFSEEKYLSTIRSLIQKVKSLPVGPRIPEPFSLLSFKRPVQIDKEDQAALRSFVWDHLGISLDDGFFALGSLSEECLPSIASLGQIGNTPESQKYALIYKMIEHIKAYSLAMKLKNLFSGMFYLRLSIANEGIDYREDVRIRLHFPVNCLWTPKDFQDLPESDLDFLKKMDHIQEFFCIEGTEFFENYEVSSVNDSPDFSPAIIDDSYMLSGFYSGMEVLDNAFSYVIKRRESSDVLSITFDRILNRETVAFPEIILFKKPIESLSYSIIANSMEHPLEGTIAVSRNGM